MDYKTLSALRPADFSEAAKSYRSASNVAQVNRERIERDISAKLRTKVEGKAATAAQAQLTALGKNFHYIQVECGLISTSLHALSTELTTAKKKLATAVSEAHAEKFTVNADGSVTYPAAGEKVDGKVPAGGTARGRSSANSSGGPIDPGGQTNDVAKSLERQAARLAPNPHSGPAQEYANRIANAIKEATEADTRWAPKLRKLLADDDLTVSNRDWSDTAADRGLVHKAADGYLDGIKPPPSDGSPKENSKWWKGLSPEEREAMLALHPAKIGALDGLPAATRDEANRVNLAQTRASYETELASIPKAPAKWSGPGPVTEEWTQWNEKYGERKKHLESALTGMGHIQKRFDQTGKYGLPEAYLLGFDTRGEGHGKVIIADGDPDKADHTAVYVPGTGTSLEGIEGDIDRGNDLWRESSAVKPTESVAVITWFDYDAPQSAIPVTDGPLIPEARDGSYARSGGPTLNQFLEGSGVAREGSSGGPGHTTVVGHSYGSTVVAEAAKNGARPDDVIVAGSPGMQAKHFSELGIKEGHMWTMAAEGDPVPTAGRLTALQEGMIVPSDPEFGAGNMKTDTTGHSAYWQRESSGEASLSLRNQANVIMGKHDKVTLE
ncbi:alpha/beta hydrolase family protein [Streptomyces sp. P38-E01]|uniref:Alpha/beta hydrolase family protein n=1 Tax=Streptomyces tardus TaxID=2780544 RepID=A0A949JCP3_9ACTN|nr:alpha/beta hydrolase [Streptomyces tardus]MBU7596593.1 alpha/beta hydrolase family protein [Streptomyces tardus]